MGKDDDKTTMEFSRVGRVVASSGESDRKCSAA